MPFGRLLKKIIVESNKTSKQIIEECNTLGKKIDKSYFSKMLNGKVPAPSEDLTRVLAQVCNCDARLLVLENYLDKAPTEIREAILNIKKVCFSAFSGMYDNALPEIAEELKSEIDKEPLADFLLMFLEVVPNINYDSFENELSIEDDFFQMTVKDTMGIPVADNGMFPLIPEGAKIRLENKKAYKSSEILAIKIKGDDRLLLRYVEKKENQCVLTALNKEYKPQTVKNDNIIILGKVSKYIIEL